MLSILKTEPVMKSFPNTDHDFDEQIGKKDMILIAQDQYMECEAYRPVKPGTWELTTVKGTKSSITTHELRLGIMKDELHDINHQSSKYTWFNGSAAIQNQSADFVMYQIAGNNFNTVIQRWDDQILIYHFNGQDWLQQGYRQPTLTTDDMLTLVRANIHNCDTFVLNPLARLQ